LTIHLKDNNFESSRVGKKEGQNKIENYMPVLGTKFIVYQFQNIEKYNFVFKSIFTNNFPLEMTKEMMFQNGLQDIKSTLIIFIYGLMHELNSTHTVNREPIV
jgi:hypothetical protein